MKYIITESKYNNIVTNYLDIKVHPDYGWNSTTAYKEEIDLWSYIDFPINDIAGYTYAGKHFGEYVNTLIILPWLDKELTDFFGPRWKPIFKEWFETNTGLQVDKIVKDPFPNVRY